MDSEKAFSVVGGTIVRTNPEELHRLIEALPVDRLGIARRLLEALILEPSDDATQAPALGEDDAWLSADLGGPLPPYEWGAEGPPQAVPVRYVPGVGLVVEGGKSIDGSRGRGA